MIRLVVFAGLGAAFMWWWLDGGEDEEDDVTITPSLGVLPVR